MFGDGEGVGFLRPDTRVDGLAAPFGLAVKVLVGVGRPPLSKNKSDLFSEQKYCLLASI